MFKPTQLEKDLCNFWCHSILLRKLHRKWFGCCPAQNKSNLLMFPNKFIYRSMLAVTHILLIRSLLAVRSSQRGLLGAKCSVLSRKHIPLMFVFQQEHLSIRKFIMSITQQEWAELWETGTFTPDTHPCQQWLLCWVTPQGIGQYSVSVTYNYTICSKQNQKKM